jgi:hypothetical protein
MTLSKKRRVDASQAIIVILVAIQLSLLLYGCAANAPTQDDLAQLTASIATVQSGDPAYYRVNPPLTKVISGLALIATRRDMPDLGGQLPSLRPSGNRSLEWTLPNDYFRQRLTAYRVDFFVARVPRVLVIVVVTVVFIKWLLRYSAAVFAPTHSVRNVTAVVFALLWCTSVSLRMILDQATGWLRDQNGIYHFAQFLVFIGTAKHGEIV